MSTINKVPASAGAEWLLAGVALLKRAPVPLIGMALLWQMLALSAGLLASAVPALGLPLQLALVLAQPLFLGGLMWVVHALDQGQQVVPAQLLQPVREGKGLSLLGTLLPQLAAPVLLGLLLLAMIGPDGFKQLASVMQQLSALAEAGKTADPSLFQGLPALRLLFWLLVLVPTVFLAMVWLIFLAVPEIVFSGRTALDALRNSLQACAHNWTAMLLFYLLTMVAGVAAAVCLLALTMTLQLVGAGMLGTLLMQLAMAVFLPLYVAATYYAWRQIMTSHAPSSSATGSASDTQRTQIEL